MVFDDAVMHDGDLVIPTGDRGMWMSVFLARRPVCGPPRMGDPDGTIASVDRGHLRFEHADTPRTADDCQGAVSEQRDSGRVVAAVFEATQTLKQNG